MKMKKQVLSDQKTVFCCFPVRSDALFTASQYVHTENTINPYRCTGGKKLPPAHFHHQNSVTSRGQAMRFRDFS